MKKYALLITLFFLLFSPLFSQVYPEKFTSISGWAIEGEKQFFSRDNLYDYINGASDFYLGYDFQDLWVVDYKNSNGQMLTLELYRHGNEMQAFGIYSEERPNSAQISKIGAQGFAESGIIFFLAQDYYVKVYNGRPEVPEEGMMAFSEAVAEAICNNCKLPQQFSWFPEKNKIQNSERYMAENFMGITGFNGVCTVNYENTGENIRLFIFKGEDKKCRSILDKYFSRIGYKKKLKPRLYNFNDPYIGKVMLSYKKGVISGIIDSETPENYQELLDSLNASVKVNIE